MFRDFRIHPPPHVGGYDPRWPLARNCQCPDADASCRRAGWTSLAFALLVTLMGTHLRRASNARVHQAGFIN